MSAHNEGGHCSSSLQSLPPLPSSSSSSSTTSNLPVEVWTHIFGFIGPADLLRAERVSHDWRQLATAERVWALCHRSTFGSPKLKQTDRWRDVCLNAAKSYKRLSNTSQDRKQSMWALIKWCCTDKHHNALRHILLNERTVTSDLMNGTDPVSSGDALPLHLAAQSSAGECIEVLATASKSSGHRIVVDLDAVDKRGGTALTIAAAAGSLECVDMLLRYGAHVGTDYASLLEEQLGGKRRRNAVPLLHQAARGGHVAIISMLLASAARDGGADAVKKMLRTEDKKGMTPLHYAAEGGDVPTVRLLLDNGADIKMQAGRMQNYVTPLKLSVHGGNLALVEFLLAQSALHEGESQSEFGAVADAFHTACELNWLEGAAEFVKVGKGDVRRQNENNNCCNALHCALSKNAKLPFIQFLIEQGADVNALTAGDPTITPLTTYCQNSSMSRDVFEYLISCGADVNKNGQTQCALESVIEQPNDRADLFYYVKRLLDLGIKMPAPSGVFYALIAECPPEVLNFFLAHPQFVWDPTPAPHALEYLVDTLGYCWNDQNKAAKLLENLHTLIAHGADINPTDLGYSPLHHAHCRLELVEHLVLKCGADIDHRDYNDHTVLQLFVQKALSDTPPDFSSFKTHVDKLRELGANILAASEGQSIKEFIATHPKPSFEHDTKQHALCVEYIRDAIHDAEETLSI
eukprot:TRINITY_DN6550_c0_g1_i2.p1 TRINITY_DN6550_c0_g1~~TRINITY_DN6550_c0_g1_i2.p1  ORF type:complete len:691 (-),score=109.87 TRINITY_DN6550_c0_g1_i2:66-2138(-)